MYILFNLKKESCDNNSVCYVLTRRFISIVFCVLSDLIIFNFKIPSAFRSRYSANLQQQLLIWFNYDYSPLIVQMSIGKNEPIL